MTHNQPRDAATRRLFNGAGPGRFFNAAAIVLAILVLLLWGTGTALVQLRGLQHDLDEVRTAGRAERTARLALLDANTVVLTAITRPGIRPDVLAFARALDALEKTDAADLPRVLNRGGETVATTTVLESLRSAWKDALLEVERGRPDGARDLLNLAEVSRDVAAFQSAFDLDQAANEAEVSRLQSDLNRTMWVVMVGQLVGSALCVAFLLVVSRRGEREAAARSEAVEHAIATREQVSRLFEMTDVLQSAGDLADAKAVLRAAAADLLPGVGGALYVFNNSRDRLVLSATWALSDGAALPEAIGVHQCWALKRGKPHVNRPDPGALHCDHYVGDDHVLEIPMIARGEILGLLQIHAAGADAEQRLEVVRGAGLALADAMSLALSGLALRDQLRSQALRDPLTGLYNRRYMEDTLQRVAQLAERERKETSLIMIDLDHFKRLNDQYGHAKGDQVLRDAASVIIGQLRESDIACRYGGEELLVIMPQCGLVDALAKAERLRQGISALSEPGGVQVSASFGVACIPATSDGAKALMADADAALYRAKLEGRDRVIGAEILRPAATDDAEPRLPVLIAAE